MGVAIDKAANAQAHGREADVAPPGPGCRVLVVPTNEELLIARDTHRIVSGLALA
jgi:acetate kinase